MATNNEVQYTISLRDLFSKNIKVAKDGADKLDASVKKANKSLLDMGKAGSMLGRFLGGAALIGFGKSVVDATVNYQYFSASLRTLMHGDVQTAKALEAQLVELAKKTPFSLTEVQDATKQLLAYGFSAGSATKNIKMLGDVASALGIPFGDIAYLYGTLKTQGRAYARDIMQFTQRGIPVVAELAKQFGTTEANVSKLVEQGKIGFKDVEKAFQSMTGKGGMFFGMMDEQTKTLGGRISALGDSWNQFQVALGKSHTGPISGVVHLLDGLVARMERALSTANLMEEAFSKYGAKDYGLGEKMLHSFTATLGLQSLTGMHSRISYMAGYATLVKEQTAKANENIESAYKAQALLNQHLAEVSKKYLGGKVDKEHYLRQRAILKAGLGDVQGIIDLSKKGATPAMGAAGAGAEGELAKAAAAEAKAPKYTQIHINIGEMKAAENLYMQSQNTMDYRTIADRVMEMLTGALNDSQRMATH